MHNVSCFVNSIKLIQGVLRIFPANRIVIKNGNKSDCSMTSVAYSLTEAAKQTYAPEDCIITVFKLP